MGRSDGKKIRDVADLGVGVRSLIAWTTVPYSLHGLDGHTN